MQRAWRPYTQVIIILCQTKARFCVSEAVSNHCSAQGQVVGPMQSVRVQGSGQKGCFRDVLEPVPECAALVLKCFSLSVFVVAE
jgi:hypothetical protein